MIWRIFPRPNLLCSTLWPARSSRIGDGTKSAAGIEAAGLGEPDIEETGLEELDIEETGLEEPDIEETGLEEAGV